MCQQQICPSNATYTPHMEINAYAVMRQLCQYICFMGYIYSYYGHMPLNKYASHITHIHTEPTLLQTSVKKQEVALFIHYVTAIYVSPKICPQNATCANYSMCTGEEYMPIYVLNMILLPSMMWPQMHTDAT